jgi:hypothetical protein
VSPPDGVGLVRRLGGLRDLVPSQLPVRGGVPSRSRIRGRRGVAGFTPLVATPRLRLGLVKVPFELRGESYADEKGAPHFVEGLGHPTAWLIRLSREPSRFRSHAKCEVVLTGDFFSDVGAKVPKGPHRLVVWTPRLAIQLQKVKRRDEPSASEWSQLLRHFSQNVGDETVGRLPDDGSPLDFLAFFASGRDSIPAPQGALVRVTSTGEPLFAIGTGPPGSPMSVDIACRVEYLGKERDQDRWSTQISWTEDGQFRCSDPVPK